jgi:chitinase
VLIIMFPVVNITCKKKSVVPQTVKDPSLRVVGYMYSDGSWDTDMSGIDFSKITDLNLAFVNPDSNGNFPVNSGLKTVIATAHSFNVKVYFSIGGGDPPVFLAALLEDDKRSQFVASVLTLADTYGVDGIDVDIEGDLINANYAPFVSELSAGLKPKKKLLSSALATWNADLIGDSTLAQYDFINVMSYDLTGPWDPSNPGQHSPFSMAQDDFNYFSKTRNVSPQKILIGLPFYGYGFGPDAPESMTYNEIVTTYPGAENEDMVQVAGGGVVYYNGIPTIKQKVSFAITSGAAGVMIWQILQDSHDSKSLLTAINSMKK